MKERQLMERRRLSCLHMTARHCLRNLLIGTQVVIYVVSDHGMLNVDTENKKDTKLIDIETIVNADDVTVMLDRGSTSFLYPGPGKEEKVQSLFITCTSRKVTNFSFLCHPKGFASVEESEQERLTILQEGGHSG